MSGPLAALVCTARDTDTHARIRTSIELRWVMFYLRRITVVLWLYAAAALVADSAPGTGSSAEKDETPSTAAGIFYDSSKANAWSIKGKVILMVPEGIFVETERTPEPGQRKPKEGEIVFIRDPFPDLATFKDLKIGSEVVRQGFSTGTLQNKVGHGVPAEVHSFELR